MVDYDPGRYGAEVGGDYDALYPGDYMNMKDTIEMLAALAGQHPDRSLLEFGIGTGRIALGLRAAGIRVAGVDCSDEMISQLREKPGAEKIDVTIGDYRTAQTGERYSVVLLAFNGIFDPRGRGAQRDILSNAVGHLATGGCFVVESSVLSDFQRSGEWSVGPRYVGDGHVELQIMRYELATNRIERTLVHLKTEGTSFIAVCGTYASPGELDIIAEGVGLQLRARFADWAGAKFTSTSSRHVSVYELKDRSRPSEPLASL